MGYREGITEGKKASAQEGFNAGFKQSVQAGYKSGLIRGITSALASLSDSSREALVPNFESSGELQNLCKTVEAISSDDALKMRELFDHNELRFQEAYTTNRDLSSNELDSLCKDLTLLLHASQRSISTRSDDERVK